MGHCGFYLKWCAKRDSKNRFAIFVRQAFGLPQKTATGCFPLSGSNPSSFRLVGFRIVSLLVKEVVRQEGFEPPTY